MWIGTEGQNGSKRSTYRVSSTKLLLCTDDGTASLGSIESSLPTDDGLARSTASAGLASNLGDGIPIFRHICGVGLC